MEVHENSEGNTGEPTKDHSNDTSSHDLATEQDLPEGSEVLNTTVPDTSAEEETTTSRRPRRRAATEARDGILARLMDNQV